VRASSQRVIRVIASVSLVLTALAGPAFADDALDKKVAAAADALAKASAAAAQAAKELQAAQSQLPAARKALADATAAEALARAEFQTARTNADIAKAAYTEALIRVTSKEAEISILQNKVDQFARTVYQQGQTSQWEIILNSTSPTDLTLRLEAIRAITQANAKSLEELVIAKKQLAIEAADAEEKHREAERLEGLAQDALAKADAAAEKAAQAKAAVDLLIAQEAAAFKLAEDDRARVKRQYDELRAEQLRVAGI
jgi:parvulin-like peptidyl-prolyl isomerase